MKYVLLDPPSLFVRPAQLPVPDVPGLHYFRDFLDHDSQVRACVQIDAARWRDDLMRRVQHYGWRYDYKARTIDKDMRIGPLPDWLYIMACQLADRTGLFDSVPSQAIVNEYLPGQGISMHVDRECFGPAVATVSLMDDWIMDLRPLDPGAGGMKSILLERGSALVMTGEARQDWLHGIAKRKRDRIGGGWRERRRRVSLTFRTVPDHTPEQRSSRSSRYSTRTRTRVVQSVGRNPRGGIDRAAR